MSDTIPSLTHLNYEERVRSSDLIFPSDQPMGAECVCSRCLKPIVRGRLIRIRYQVQEVGKDYEFRYHEACWKGE